MIYVKGIRINELQEDSYLASVPALRSIRENGELLFTKPVTFLVGENGSGKSTLLEALAVKMRFSPEGGSRDTVFSTNGASADLSDHMTVMKFTVPKDGFFLRAESYFNVASYLDENSDMLRYGGISMHEQSHGESFLSLILNRFEGNGLYILDEPEAALSVSRQMSLITAMHDLVKRNSQFIIATHSPILTAYPDADIYEMSDRGICNVKYEETENYRLTRDFIKNPERMIRYLTENQ